MLAHPCLIFLLIIRDSFAVGASILGVEVTAKGVVNEAVSLPSSVIRRSAVSQERKSLSTGIPTASTSELATTSANVSEMGKLPVAVVEEHHEVLPYWFAAKASPVPVLVHFDAHPDLALPAAPADGSWHIGSKSANSREAARKWMRANDEFIEGAAIEGRLRGMVWVFPNWDQQGPSHEGSKLPYIQLSAFGALKNGKLCECNWRSAVHGMKEGVAVPLQTLADIQLALPRKKANCFDSDEDAVDMEDCRLSDRNLTLLEISEADVLAHGSLFNAFLQLHTRRPIVAEVAGLMSTGRVVIEDSFLLDQTKKVETLPQPLPIVLDIDEDYFAQDSTPSHSKLFGRSWVRQLNHLLGRHLCPKRATVSPENIESIANAAFRVVLANARTPQHEAPVLLDTVSQLGEELVATGVDGLVCDDNDRRNASTAFGLDLLQLLHSLPEKSQKRSHLLLRILQQEGVCLTTSMATEVEIPKVHACFSGYDSRSAEDTDFGQEEATLAHSPAELRWRVRNFGKLLRATLGAAETSKSSNRNPSVLADVKQVTICRSVRDGYLPRDAWHEVEGTLLTELDGWAENHLSRRTQVAFDSNLLGGQYGWEAHAMEDK